VLLIDAGNSRCKWAYFAGGDWSHRGVAENAEWFAMQSSLATLPIPSRVIVSNVGGEVMAQRLRVFFAEWDVPIEFVVARREQCGVRNNYEEPSRLGSDRWVALIAAWQRTQRACLVVNCGTATTIDALSDQGDFLGGLILPGISLMKRSLLQNTAQLVDVTGSLQEFPLNTADAIHSGAVLATLGAIRHQYEMLDQSEKAVCLLSGGAADHIQHQLRLPVDRVDDLVLQGLKTIGEASA